MRLLDFIILSLATFRLSTLLAYEDGPGDIFAWLRYWAGVEYDTHSQPYGVTNIARGLLCQWCNSVWVATGLSFIYALSRKTIWLLLPLALSAVTVLISKWEDR